MEGRVGSGVLKKKSSSGCLIIKKGSASKNSGGGLGGLGDSSKGKKRARVIARGSDSSSSDDDESLEFMRRKVNEKRLKKGSTGYRRNEHDREDSGIDASVEKKRSRLDLFEFDEYDEFDMKKMRNEFLQDRYKRVEGNAGGDGKESNNRNLVDKRKQGSYFNGSNSGRSKNVGGSGMKDKGFGSEDDEAHMPISLLKMKCRETAGESIRLQGKNGVLKVMVNKKKKMDFPSQHNNHDFIEKDLSAELPVLPDSKTPTSRGSVGKERSALKETGEMKLEKGNPISNKNRKGKDSSDDETDTVLKLATSRSQASSKKAVKKEAGKSQNTEISVPVKGKEGNVKRGGSTEKQMLREKIRGMLIDAGWSIDYRPRRNRDYLDAVYISPSGTAYWSIVKAYDAFKKHLEEDSDKVLAEVGSPSVAPLSEDLINKLTRQTKKKIADEMRRKRKEDSMAKSAKKSVAKEAEERSDSDQSEDRLSSFMKQSQKLRSMLSKVDQDSDGESSDGSLDRKPRKVKFEKTSKSISVQGRTSKVIGRCTLLVRGSDRGNDSDFDGYIPYKGKRTVLAWLIDCGTAKSSEKVQYMNRRRTKVMLEGWITRDGIHCGCCSKILTVSKFELHAGSKLRQPFQNIFLESGSSLLQCQIDAWNSQEESLHRDFFTVDVDGDDPDDDTCAICGDGGDLICCDSCPSTFHQICLGIKMLPSGDWHCPNCICKLCGLASGNIDEENNDELNSCNFCEKKYHKSCSERAHPQPVSSCSASFCGLKCQEIYDHLQKILGIKHELEAGISWSIIQRTDISDASQRGFPLRVECNSKLAVALSVMDECFLPIIDRRSEINIIHNVVYNCGSNFNRLNYRGFYTAVLERGDEILAAASIRFHGDRLVEMPFIGTRDIYRRQGMCRRLLSAIENELSTLKIGQVIIPAISEHMNTWTTAFGFDELEDTHKKEIKSMNVLVFPGIDMLQKQLVKQENSDGALATESTKNQPPSPALVEKSEASEQNKQNSSDSEGDPISKSHDEAGTLDSDSPTPAIPSDALQETDSPAPKISYALQETEIPAPNTSDDVHESVNSKCSPISAEGNEEHRFLKPSDSPVKSAAEDACKTEDAGALKLTDAPAIENGVRDSAESVFTEDASKIVDSGTVNSASTEISVPDSSEKATIDDACNIEDVGTMNSAIASSTENGAPDSSEKAAIEDSCKVEDAPEDAIKIEDSGTVNSAISPSIEISVPDSSEKAAIDDACNTEDVGTMNSATETCAPDSSEKAAIEDSCKVEDAGTINPTDAPATENGVPCPSEKSSEVSKTVSNGCHEPHPGSVSEASAEDNNGGSNGDEGESVVALSADSDRKAFNGGGDPERPSPQISPSQASPQIAAATE